MIASNVHDVCNLLAPNSDVNFNALRDSRSYLCYPAALPFGYPLFAEEYTPYSDLAHCADRSLLHYLLHDEQRPASDHDASEVLQDIPLAPLRSIDGDLHSSSVLRGLTPIEDPIAHRPFAGRYAGPAPSLYASPQPRQVAHVAALRSLAASTSDIHYSPVTLPRVERSERSVVAAMSRTEIDAAIRMPCMKVSLAPSTTNSRPAHRASTSRYSPYPNVSSASSSSDYLSPESSSPSSPSGTDSSASSPSASRTAAASKPRIRTRTRTHTRYTCPLSSCPSPHKTYGRPADLERHILTAGTHLLPPDAWLCCGLPLAAARLRPDIPQSVLEQTPRMYAGVPMVGGCGQHNSRKDALGRHLAKNDGVCWTELDGAYLLGNMYKDVCKRQAVEAAIALLSVEGI